MIELLVIRDGSEYPAWALRAGDEILATEYDHGARCMVVWLGGTGSIAQSEEVEAMG